MKICLSCEGISATELRLCGSCGTELLPIESVHYPLRRGEEDAGNPLLGSRIDGKFRVTSVLGKGGMGTVFRAVHEVSLVPVALKVLHPRYAARSDYRQGFLAEARKAGRVVHEHCARILDVGEAEDGTVYIAQELVEGETLDEWIHGEEGIAPGDAVEILAQICRALVASHAVGLVHRDLSTRNVMVVFRDGQPWVKLLDFGIAKGAPSRVGHEDPSGPQATASFANPAYSAPEQLAGQDVDARADLYSLGVIAYEALCRRLPVEGGTGRELARATLEGHLRPLPAIPGVPAPLHRLVEQLLARDPARRPGSAKEVLGILERIQRPGGLALRRLAVGLTVGSVLLLLLAYTAGGEAYLQSRIDTSLDLVESTADVRVQEVRFEELAEGLRFDFGGFDPEGLRVEVSRGESQVVLPLAPEVAEDGAQLMLTPADPGFRSLLDTLRAGSATGDPSVLSFRVEGYAPLAHARVLVDDDPPELALAREPGDPDPGVVPDTRLLLSIHDLGTLVDVRLRVRCLDRSEELPLQPRQYGEEFLSLGSRLSSLPGFGSARGVDGPVEIDVWAVDAANNEAWSDPVVVPFLDFRAPEIEAVSARGGGSRITYLNEQISLRMTLDDVEPDLEVLVSDESGARQVCGSPESAGGERIDLVLGPFHPGEAPPFADGRYRFQLRDRAGNLSDVFPERLTFHLQDAQLAFTPATANAFVLGGRSGTDGLVVTDGEPADLHVAFNEAYLPVEAQVLREGPTAAVELRDERQGLYTLHIGTLENGPYQLRIRMRNLSQDADEDQTTRLLVLRSPPFLDLPDTGRARFLPELEALDFFEADGEGRLSSGQGWTLVPEDWRLVRGDLWFGTGESTAHLDLRPDSSQAPLFSGLNPLPGENRLELDLVDVLGRPVRVTLGEELAPVEWRAPDRQVRRVAAFQFQSRPPEPREEVRVEYGQDARLFILSPLNFLEEDEDEIVLRSSQSRLPPHSRSLLDNGGTQLEFLVLFGDLENATKGLAAVPEEEYDQGRSFRLGVTLETPAGRHPVELSLRTSRSVLTRVTLADLAGERSLPDALGRLALVPVLAPNPTFDDPVPGDLAARHLYRTAPVHNVRTQDVYLQEGELTRAQYEAAVAGFLALDEGKRGPVASLVHSADSMRGERLTRKGMIPALMKEDEESWRLGLEAGDRPVTGVSFFQAYTLTRIIGVLVAGNPDLIRLPLGVEMEMAALGGAPPGLVLNGLGPVGRQKVIEAHEAAVALQEDPLLWPPTSAESARLGDAVTTGQGYRLAALDFGIREWVLDLPYSVVFEMDALLREWMSDQGGHAKRALDLARGAPWDPSLTQLQGHLATFGVVRGLALGEPHLLVDGASGDDLRERVEEDLRSLPGVVRVLQLRRDGQDLLEDRVDPRLRLVGLRLAGGAEFVGEVRAR